MDTYIHSFSALYSDTSGKTKWLLRCLAIIAIILLSTSPGIAEGTKQLEPNSPSPANGSLGFALYQGGWTINGQRIPFATAGCLDKYRLNFYVADPATELIYLGFKQDGAQPLYFQLRDPDGTVVPGFSFASQPIASANGYIASWTEAVAGPKFGTTNPTGYKPLIVTPTKIGNYYIEFAQDAAGNTNAMNGTIIEFFDLSIYSGTIEKPGRLWSKAWQFSDQIAGGNSPETEFYIFSDDGIVTKLNINRWQGGHFMFYCNQWGAVNTGNWLVDRLSRTAANQPQWPGDFPQYKVFLNDPDNAIFPTGIFGQICDVSSTSNCDGSVDILVKVNKPGSVSLFIDIDPQGVNNGEDVTLTADVTGTPGCDTWETVPWNGIDGLGQPVQNGASIHMNIDYLNGLTNLPIYDIERNNNGIMVDLVRPIPSGSSKLKIYWDDHLLTNCAPVCTELAGCIYNDKNDACHKWPGNNQGDMDIYNSWWYYLTQNTINLNLVIKRTPATPISPPTGPNPVCAGQTGVIYTISAIPDAENYVWTLPDGSTFTSATNSVSVNFPNLTSGGTLFVHGVNTSCGSGLNSPPLAISVNPDPLPTITGNPTVCNGTTTTYTGTAGLSTYNWNVTGGTYTAALNVCNVNWTAAGTQTLTMTTTSFNCGTRNTAFPVTVSPLPNVNFSYTNYCAAQPVQFTDISTITSGSNTGWSWNFGDPTSGANNTSTLQNPTHVFATGGTYNVTLTVTSDQSCSASHNISVVVTTPPSANAGPPADAFCASGSYTLAAASTLNSPNRLWSSSGTGTFNSNTALNPVYTPSAADIAAGTVTLTLTADGNTPCGPVSDAITLTINPLPVAIPGPPGATCQGVSFTVSGANALNSGSVTWTENGPGSLVNATTLTPTYVPTPGETGLVTLTLTVNGALTCSSEISTSTKALTVNPLPIVDAGPDATLCAANTHTLNGSQQFCSPWLWTTAGDGTFSNPNLLAPVYTPGAADIAAGSAILTLTGDGTGACIGLTAIDQMTLFIDPMPTVNAGIDDAFCVLNPINITGAGATNYTSLQWTGGDGSFNNSTLMTPTYMPGNLDFNNGSVTLTLTAQGNLTCSGQFVTDSRVFSVSPYPLVDAGPDDYICSNITSFTLAGSGNNYNLGNIQWTVSGGDGTLSNPNILNPVYTAGPIDLSTSDRTITFTLTLQGIGTCSGVFVSDPMVLKIDPTPISNAGPDDEICGQQPYQLNPTAQYQSTINWTTSGTGTFSNPAILNPTYTPSAADVGSIVVLTLDLSGCQSLTGDDFMWLTVHPDPSATLSGSTGICEGTSTPITIALTGTPPWSITYTNGTTPVTVNNINSSPYVFTVSPAISTTWSITSGSDVFCTIPSDSIHGVAAITVNPLPDPFVVTGSNQGYYCEGDTGVVIGLNNSQVGMNYTLLRNGLSIGLTLPGTGSALVFGLYTTPGQYSVQGQNPVGNCFAMMLDTINVIMNPIPVTDFTTNTACASDTTYFTLSGNFLPRTSNWHWTFGDGTFATYNAPYSPSHVYPSYGTYIVTLSVIDTNGCQYTVTHPVDVLPHPNAFFSFSTPNCLDGVTNFTDLSNNPSGQGYLQQWIWTFGDGTPADTINFPDSPNVTHKYLAQGNYNVTLTVLNSKGCLSEFQAVVTVSNRPKSKFTFLSTCQDLPVVFTDISEENLGGQITSYQWNFGDPTSGAMNFSTLQNPTHIYAAAGNYTVTLIVTNLNGCSDTAQNLIAVKAKPEANFFSSPGCLSSPTLFLADSTLINPATTATYAWEFGDGGTALSPHASHIYLAPGTYMVTLTITDTAGCEGFKSLPVIINPPPVAHFTANTDNCQSEPVAFLDFSTSPTGFISKWIWNFGDGNTDTIDFPTPPNVNHSYANAGNFSVTLTVINSEGCSKSESRLVNILGAPNSEFIFTGQCEGTAVVFSDLSTVTGTQTISTWNWNFGDPTSGVQNNSTLQNPTHTYAIQGTYSVTLITFTGNNCSDTISYNVSIQAKPLVDFTTQSACANNPAAFAPAGMAVTTISSWYWTFGDGGNSNLQAPTHTYTAPGTYNVTLTITDTAGCSNFKSKPIVIAPLPDANFGYTTPTCQGDAVNFTDFSTAASGYLARWIWDFGDGSTQTINFPNSPDVTHQYSNSGTFNVTLTVKTNDSCTNQLTRVVTILPKPTADFSHGAGCQGNAVSFSDMSASNTTGNISGWAWNFGDPTAGSGNNSTLQNPTHIYNTAGNYTITLIVSIPGGCSDTATHPITVSPPPTVDFTPVAGCNGDTTQFTSSTLVNMGTTQGWYWQFGDGGTSSIADPVHVYATAATYTVTLTITDTAGCTNTKIKPVTVIPGPTAAFSSSTPSCSGLPINFIDLSNANGGTLSTWYWAFGDGMDTTFTASVPNFSHTYLQAGTFVVTLHVMTALGCENTVQQTVAISPSPIAGFAYANTCQGQSTQFSDMTSLNGGSSITLRTWDFGDPGSGMLNTSTLVNPIHNYAQPGSYTVTLTTLNGGGCVDTLQQNVSITPKPGVDFYSDSLICLGNNTTLYTDTTATNTGTIQYYEWDFGDGSPHAFTQNATHTYSVAGTFTVMLSVQDTSGCENVKTHPLTIHTGSNSMFNYTGICENAPTLFTDQSIPPQGETIVSWFWEFMQSGITIGSDTLQNPEYMFNLPGTYTVKLTTTTETGCPNTKIQPVQIWNKPTAYFKYSASPCANGLVQFQDSSFSYQGTVNSWQWEFEPYQYGTGTNPSHQYYAVDSCYSVNLMIEDLRGCMDTTAQQVCVPPALSVDFSTDLTCFGDPVHFDPQLLTPEAPADSLVTFSWNFGDPVTGNNNVSTLKSPAHTFSNVGFYTVNFSTTDKYGCTATSYKNLQVNALPQAGFSYTSGQCDSTIVFSSTSVDTTSSINTYIWQYGDGTSDTLTTATSTHKYNNPDEYMATLTIINANGCTDTFTDTVTRSACIVAATIGTATNYCQNYDLAFADMSTCDGIISEWNWDFGDGSPTVNYNTFKALVNHTFANPGPYTIRLKVSTLVGTSTISDSTTLDILVKPTPLAGFITEPVCLGVKAEFSDTTHANGATALSFQWEFGDAGDADTSNLRNPQYLYSVPGTYTPQMVATNQFGCADTATSSLTVNGLPDASFTNSLACSGLKTYFFDSSQADVSPLAEWGWRVNDSIGIIGYMHGATPSFTFNSIGRYQVMLTVADSNGCADTLIQQVSVQPSPLSAFSYTENVEEIQGQIQFNNESIDAKNYYWDFGNGETSYAESPKITYAEDGSYQVILVSVNDFGCQDTARITYEMMFKGLYVPNAFAPGGTVLATRIWKPIGVNLASYIVEVFNSHGMMLWNSTLLDEHGAPAEGWDGSYNEKLCQEDVYVWKITAIFRDGSIWANQDVGEHKGLSEPVYGTITLIR